MTRGRNRFAALVVFLGGLAVAAALFFSGVFTTHATQNPTISLDMVTTGNGYCDSAGVVTGGVTCANSITPASTNCVVNDAGGSCNEMVVGTIDQCVTTAANNNTHNQAAQLIVQNVEDLVGWQIRPAFDKVGKAVGAICFLGKRRIELQHRALEESELRLHRAAL